MRASLLTGGVVVAALTCSLAGGAGDKPRPDAPAPALSFSLLALDGTGHALGQNDARRARAFVFLSIECPIATESQVVRVVCF